MVRAALAMTGAERQKLRIWRRNMKTNRRQIDVMEEGIDGALFLVLARFNLREDMNNEELEALNDFLVMRMQEACMLDVDEDPPEIINTLDVLRHERLALRFEKDGTTTGLPIHPDIVYRDDGWKGWDDFLGVVPEDQDD